MKTFCFTVDDNVRFFKEITNKNYGDLFEHPYLAMFKRLHEEFDLKVQLNLFDRDEEFDLSRFSEKFAPQWEENADWLKLSFHSKLENVRPYEHSDYDEVNEDCKRVNGEILRFASPKSLAKTTTIHYCQVSPEGIRALEDNAVLGLLGLFGTPEAPRTSYGLHEEDAARIRMGEAVKHGKIYFAAVDVVLNRFSKEEIIEKLRATEDRDCVRVMIHEQYFYPDYKRYQPDFEEKLRAAFRLFQAQNRQSRFFEELI